MLHVQERGVGWKMITVVVLMVVAKGGGAGVVMVVQFME